MFDFAIAFASKSMIGSNSTSALAIARAEKINEGAEISNPELATARASNVISFNSKFD
jgi:hypothetical protein